jgi:hypothetical protein
VAGPAADVLPARGALRSRQGIGGRVDRDPDPAPAGAGIPDLRGLARRQPGQGPVRHPAAGDVIPGDPGTGLRPVHQRRQAPVQPEPELPQGLQRRDLRKALQPGTRA